MVVNIYDMAGLMYYVCHASVPDGQQTPSGTGAWGVARTMAAIAGAESGGDPAAKGGPNSDGSYDLGLWQINDKAHPEITSMNWKDPLLNAREAFNVFQSQGFDAWVSYHDSSSKAYNAKSHADYLKNLKVIEGWDTPMSDDDMKRIESGNDPLSSGVPGLIPQNPLSGVGGWISSITGWLGEEFKVIGVFLLAVIILVVGVLLIVRPYVEREAQNL